ncbi:hypothetical protein [Streptomyces sp. NPDC059994]|uniref:hypothetical protein n=1 Tax=Streptomyces sp. NPDC059994 TaxID=3347029 RepID=UPI0036B9A7B2
MKGLSAEEVYDRIATDPRRALPSPGRDRRAGTGARTRRNRPAVRHPQGGALPFTPKGPEFRVR